MKKIKGIPLIHHKNTDKQIPSILPVPTFVRLPMQMHSGMPATPIVQIGDYVKRGQLIAQATGNVSAPVHASVSGKIKAIDAFDPISGNKATSIVIESKQSQIDHHFVPPHVTDFNSFMQAVGESGVVGLGGAGYPTAAKLNRQNEAQLDYILINGAECEPYITSDTRMMVDETQAVFDGTVILQRYINAKQAILCIEENKPDAIKKLTTLCKEETNISVHVLPSKYPQGERKVLVYNVTGRIVPEGARLSDVGCLVINCSTVAVIAKYIQTGMPLTSRIVTVDGSGIIKPQNIIAPIGTPIKNILEYCGLRDSTKKIIIGGPMMGVAVSSTDVPTIKTTNALLAFTAKDTHMLPPSNCIRCGRCITHCPMNLMPSNIEDAFLLKKPDMLATLRVNMCVECACCDYVCPAKRPLAQVMSLSKNMLWEHKQNGK